MRKPVQISVAALIVVIAGVMAWKTFRPREPVYEGRPISQWTEIYTSGFFTITSHTMAEHAIKQAGTNAIPTLLRMLQTRDSVLTRELIMFANRQPFIHVHFTPAEEYRLRAIAALGVLGPQAKSAVPALIGKLNDPDFFVKLTSAHALKQIDPVAAAKAGVK